MVTTISTSDYIVANAWPIQFGMLKQKVNVCNDGKPHYSLTGLSTNNMQFICLRLSFNFSQFCAIKHLAFTILRHIIDYPHLTLIVCILTPAVIISEFTPNKHALASSDGNNMLS